MTNRPSDTGDDTGVGPDRGVTIGMGPWQKVVGIIGIVVLLWVGNRMSDIVFADGPGPGGNSAVENQQQVPGGPTPVEGQEHQPPGGPDGHGAGGDDPPVDDASQVAITADKLAFRPDRIELSAGEPVAVALTAADIQHDLVVDEIDVHVVADRGETAVGELMFLEPGSYVGYCSVPGHREAGMELEIVVAPSDGATPPTTA